MIKVIVYTVCFAVIVGLCYYGYYAIDSRGYTRGYNVADAEWKTKATEALETKITNIKEFDNVITQRALEHKADLDALDSVYAEDLENVERGKDATIAAVLDGIVKLYKPINKKPIGFRADCDGVDEETGLTICVPGGDDSKERELHPKTAAFLFGESLRADGYTEQLGRCQDAVEILEKRCGEQDANSTD